MKTKPNETKITFINVLSINIMLDPILWLQTHSHGFVRTYNVHLSHDNDGTKVGAIGVIGATGPVLYYEKGYLL